MRRAAALLAIVLAAVAASAAIAADPSVTTGAATDVKSSQATLNGTVNPQGQSTRIAFQYGENTQYGRQTPFADAGSGAAAVPAKATVTDVQPGTTYHYRAIAVTASSTVTGADHTFTTSGSPPPPLPRPTLVTGAATGISASGATLNGTVDPNGREATWWFEIGPTTSYGVQTAPRSAGAGGVPVTVSSAVNGLKAGTAYHYRLVGVGPGGTVLGPDATFTTGQSARLAFFGHTAFTSPSRVTGIFLGCLGATACDGSLRLSRSNTTLGARRSFHISAQDGGIVHVTLNALGARLLRARGSLRVQTDVTGPGGQRFGGVVTLRRFV